MGLGTKVITNASAEVLAANNSRSLMVLSNVSGAQGGEDIFLGFDQAAVLNSGITLPDGKRLVITPRSELAALLPCQVNAICAGASETLAYEVR